jgi:hypothetical protein
MHRISVLLFNTLFVTMVAAQETLPAFSLSAKPNGKILISWHNNFESVTQISIQRSYDSLKNFTTFLTVPDPVIPENGFVDSKAPRSFMFYRLFIVLQNGNYIFSKSKRAYPDSAGIVKNKVVEEKDDVLSRAENQRISYLRDNNQKLHMPGASKIEESPKVEIDKIIFVKQNDSVIAQLLTSSMVHKFRDSVLTKTKDTLVFIGADTILVKIFVPKEVYKISNYVFTGKDGNISISLPDAGRKKYTVKFLEQDLSAVLEIKDIKEHSLVVDKTNFIHAGWFRFELYEDGKLKEKNKLFIPKDF